MIKKTIELKTQNDVLSLDIIDWNRLNGHWRNPGEALNTISSWLTLNGHGGFFASWLEIDSWREYYHGNHRRNDFPGWEHVGSHVEVGMAYWDWFMDTREDDRDCLKFSDSPDFFGTIGNNKFLGDIGKVSASTFSMAVKQFVEGDLWITLAGNGSLQIVLEARYSPLSYITVPYHKRL